jgi:hypothetical protein
MTQLKKIDSHSPDGALTSVKQHNKNKLARINARDNMHQNSSNISRQGSRQDLFLGVHPPLPSLPFIIGVWGYNPGKNFEIER